MTMDNIQNCDRYTKECFIGPQTPCEQNLELPGYIKRRDDLET
jgi:hypothetical protein